MSYNLTAQLQHNSSQKIVKKTKSLSLSSVDLSNKQPINKCLLYPQLKQSKEHKCDTKANKRGIMYWHRTGASAPNRFGASSRTSSWL